jgi:hypothetical protein
MTPLVRTENRSLAVHDYSSQILEKLIWDGFTFNITVENF